MSKNVAQWLRGKMIPIIILVVAAGGVYAISQMPPKDRKVELLPPPAVPGEPTVYDGDDDITKDEQGLATARNLGKWVAQIALRLTGRAAAKG